MRACPARIVTLSAGLVLMAAGCAVGPRYQRPIAATPENFKEAEGWKLAQPTDEAIRGPWWELFDDTQLNAFEQQVTVSNQTIVASAAGFLAARALVTQARAQYYPTVTTEPSVTVSRGSALRVQTSASSNGTAATGSPSTGLSGPTAGTSRVTDYSLPFDASYQPDLFGRVRNVVRMNTAAAQVSAADLENTRLTVQAELAVDYFQVRGQDALKQLLDSTVAAYQEALDLTRARYETGIDSDETVAQAETQLESAQAQDTNLGILRAQYEHAIALLLGQPASTFSMPDQPLTAGPPDIPLNVPSRLLERRPDIAAAERSAAQANAQIGVAKAAFFPTLTLSGSAGFASSSLATWLTWPSRVWAVGPALAATLFDGGLRKATVAQYEAAYDQTVANYRETVLTAFQQVEDSLSTLRILSAEVQQQNAAVQSAQRNLQLATDRYRFGIDPYLNVITAQTTLLGNQQTAVNLQLQQMTASVGLIEALGGGWDTSQLPTPQTLAGQP